MAQKKTKKNEVKAEVKVTAKAAKKDVVTSAKNDKNTSKEERAIAKAKAERADVKTKFIKQEVKYIIEKMKYSKADRVCHYSYLLKETVATIQKMGIEVEFLGKHSYAFHVPEKKTSAWRKMNMFGLERDEKGHFIKK